MAETRKLAAILAADVVTDAAGWPVPTDSVSKRFLVLDRRTVFSHQGRMGILSYKTQHSVSLLPNFLIALLRGEFCNNIDKEWTPAQLWPKRIMALGAI
jgi:hypothetical protein